MLFGLNKKLINDLSRFVAGVDKNFRDYIELFIQHPSWKKCLGDKGEGSPPMEFLVTIELGLRNYELRHWKRPPHGD